MGSNVRTSFPPSLPGDLSLLLDSNPAQPLDDEFSFGIEEEYFLADALTLQAIRQTPKGLFKAIDRRTCGQGVREFLQAQAEVNTSPHVSMASARCELATLRNAVAAAAAEYGLVIVASGTHPTACWEDIAMTPKQRYRDVMDDLQFVGRRDLLCGMHVHVQLPNPEQRVDVMTRMIPYIPLFLALSTSSPFWASHCTGMKGYRLASYDELPRTGIPELFATAKEYDDYVAALVRAEVMPDASYIWWTIRPSHKLPTLELRAPDCCTRLDDAIAIAALYRGLVRHLSLHPYHNGDLTAVDRCIAVENKWRAQRYGVQGTFVTKEHGAVSVADFLDQTIQLIASDTVILGCTTEVEHCRAIVTSGTSADAQLAVFRAHEAEGRDRAFTAVLKWLTETTLQG
jgi:glutamate---cysteine ligase / carboxylate-amine ligase